MAHTDPEKPRLASLGWLKNQFLRLTSTTVGFTTSLPEAIQTVASPRSRALEQCARAHNGHYCRTNMFLRNGDMAEWMEGTQDPKTAQWITRIVIEAINLSGDGAPLGAKVQQFITLDNDLRFADAIAALSKYEHGHIASGTLSVPDDIIDNLGKNHFITFAENNGFIFDINGTPHPTLNGEIVTDGIFAKDAIARARAFYAKAPGAIQSANFFITAQPATNADMAQLVDATIDLTISLSNANELHSHITALAKATHIVFQEPNWGHFSNKNTYLFKYDVLSIKESFPSAHFPIDHVMNERKVADLTFLRDFMIKYGCFFEPRRDKSQLARLNDVYDSLIDEGCRVSGLFGLEDHQRDRLIKNFETIRLYAEIMYLRGTLNRSANNAHDFQRYLNQTKSEIPKLQQRYAALSDTPDTGWKIASIIFDDRIPDISPVFAELKSAAETLRTTLGRHLGQAKNQVISGSYASTAPLVDPPSIALTPP